MMLYLYLELGFLKEDYICHICFVVFLHVLLKQLLLIISKGIKLLGNAQYDPYAKEIGVIANIIIETESVSVSNLIEKSKMDITTADKNRHDGIIKENIKAAYNIQKERYTNSSVKYNSDLNSTDIKSYCHLTSDCEELLGDVYEEWGLSARTRNRIVKVARTIADYEGCRDIDVNHLNEAIFYRKTEYSLWNKKGDMVWN